jgi:hypothetical protein
MSMNRQALQEISRLRRQEAAALLKAKRFAGAYYLVGYSVECALKACIAKQTKKHDFPDKSIADKAYIHDLEKLLALAGLNRELELDMRASKSLEVNWALVKDWKETSRYLTTIADTDARDLYAACTARKHGILYWIRTKW